MPLALASFIEGAKWMGDKINKKNIKTPPGIIKEMDSDRKLSINDYRYNYDTKKMELMN